MIVWCAYCQTFQGEAPPFDKMIQTHSICPSCADAGLELTVPEIDRIRALASFYRRLWQAGRRGNPEEIQNLAERAIEQGIRPIDLLFGFAAPALAKVGELWAANHLSTGEEHRFTRSCEYLADLVGTMVEAGTAAPGRATVLLANVQGNGHTLGVRFARLGLLSIGIPARAFAEPVTPARLVEAAVAGDHQVVGLSIAMFDQLEPLERTIETLLGDARFVGRIVVSGAAINFGLGVPVSSPRVQILSRPRFDIETARIFQAAPAAETV